MSFPVSYFDQNGRALTDREEQVFAEAKRARGTGEDDVAFVIRLLHQHGFSVTRVCDPFGGQISRVKVEVFGDSPEEVAQTLREFSGRCDAASQSSSCAYGQTVIERNLVERDGDLYSWKGRITLHPSLGEHPPEMPEE